jgi:hypothetical protein
LLPPKAKLIKFGRRRLRIPVLRVDFVQTAGDRGQLLTPVEDLP